MYYLSFGKSSLFITRTSDINNSLEITYNGFQLRQIKTTFAESMINFHTLIGMKHIKGYALLIVASLVSKVTTIGMSPISQIKAITWIAIAPENQQEAIKKELAQTIQEIEIVFENGLHYYSDLYDLSIPYKFNKLCKPDMQTREYYDQFIWNINLAKMDGRKSGTEVSLFWKYCSKIIQGYLEEYSGLISSSQKMKYILISRRSSKKAGTRYYSRGIDDDGNVANFTQTEQIAFVGELVFDHLQIRGSVPAFFAQIGVSGISGEMVIQRTASLTKTAFFLHFQRIFYIYKRVLAVNLLSQKKQQQKTLSNFFEDLVYQTSDQMTNLRYQFYDFHQQCKNNKFENSQNLMDKLDQVIKAFGFSCFNESTHKILKQQTGVFRTNCLDCLDRTNYIQSRLALRSLKYFMLQYCQMETVILIKDYNLLGLPVHKTYQLLGGFNSLWADNGDSISLLYTGIPSTHTDITRTGERTVFGTVNHKFRSLMRFYTQFTDHKKQNAINCLVNPTSPTKYYSMINDFHTTLLFSLQIEQNKEQTIASIKQYLKRQKPTLLLCFIYANRQRNLLSKITCAFSNDRSSLKSWAEQLSVFAEKHSYVLVGDLKNQNCWMGVYCIKSAESRITQVKKQNISKEISFGEALLLKMKLNQSSFIFAGVNCSKFQEFSTVFDEVHSKGFQKSKLGQFKSSSFYELDYRIVLGNTGSRILMNKSQLQSLRTEFNDSSQKGNKLQMSKIISKALDSDQMYMQSDKSKSRIFKQYSQAPIHSIPSSNRLVFWNDEGIILRVRDYLSIGRNSLTAVIDYEVGRGLKHKKYS